MLDLIEPALGTTLPTEVVEQQSTWAELRELAVHLCAWTNDIYSFNKECGERDPINLIQVLRQEHGIDAEAGPYATGLRRLRLPASLAVGEPEQVTQSSPPLPPSVGPASRPRVLCDVRPRCISLTRFDLRMAHPPANQVDIWIAAPHEINDPELLALYDRLLSDDERGRQRAFVFDKHRREYLVAHALLRSTLSKYATTRPSEWRFSKNAYGRPAIEPPSGLRFNLSHHPTMVVCAVTTGAELGVDVEPLLRGNEILGIAEAAFASRELADLRALPEALARDRAVSLWTLKEAYIKARGLGLALPLDGFAFSFDEPQPHISFGPTIADEPQRWAFRTRDVNGHRIALAVECGEESEPEIRLHFNVPLRDAQYSLADHH